MFTLFQRKMPQGYWIKLLPNKTILGDDQYGLFYEDVLLSRQVTNRFCSDSKAIRILRKKAHVIHSNRIVHE